MYQSPSPSRETERKRMKYGTCICSSSFLVQVKDLLQGGVGVAGELIRRLVTE